MDIGMVLTNFIGSLIMVIAFEIIGKLAEKESIKEIKSREVVSVLLAGIIISLINIYITTLTSIVATYLVFLLLWKYNFKKGYAKCIVATFLSYVCIIVGELLSIIVLSIFFQIFTEMVIEDLKRTVYINVLVSLVSIGIGYLFRNRLNSTVNKVGDADNSSVFFITLLILITIFSLIYNITGSGVKLDFDFIMTMVLMITSMLIAIIIIKQRSSSNQLGKKYSELTSYSKRNEKLVEEYRTSSHEHKNQLIILKEMVKPTNKDFHEYINTLIVNADKIKFRWINDLKYLPIIGLKGLLNYKAMEIEDRNISLDIQVDPSVEKSKLKYLDLKRSDALYSILGVYLDNALEAASESKDKVINITIYKEKQNVIIEIENTYKGKINTDKIDQYGYSSKGNKRGVGLHLVSIILSENEVFTAERLITNELFSQKLMIHCDKIKKASKRS